MIKHIILIRLQCIEVYMDCECKFIEELKAIMGCNFYASNCLYIKNLTQFNATVNFLINANIPFELSFQVATRSDPKVIIINIKLNPTTSIVKKFQLQEGGDII